MLQTTRGGTAGLHGSSAAPRPCHRPRMPVSNARRSSKYVSTATVSARGIGIARRADAVHAACSSPHRCDAKCIHNSAEAHMLRVRAHAPRAKRMGMCKARASAGGMWGAHLRAREPRGSGLLEVVFMLASTLPRLPAARKPLNPCGIHPKRAGTAWDASRPWCGGLRPMPQPTVERLEPGARALQNLNTNLIQFNTI